MYQTPSPLLLSRVAESAYWAGRYLERAEGTARLIKAHSDLVMDLPRAANVGWQPLLALMGSDHGVDLGDLQGLEERVMEHLVADEANPGSIRSSVAAVHRNQRVTRAVMPVEAVEVLTELHQHVEATAVAAIDRRTRGAWLMSVIRGCQTLTGVMEGTMSHDDAYSFSTVGRQLERADLTTRVLDVQAEVLTRRTGEALAPYLEICWFAALRSVSALQAFRRTGATATPEATIAFLLRDAKCPRTIESCLVQASRWLLEIPGHEAAMAACATADSMLQDADVRGLVDGRLHEFADALQQALDRVHDEIGSSWFAAAHTSLSI